MDNCCFTRIMQGYVKLMYSSYLLIKLPLRSDDSLEQNTCEQMSSVDTLDILASGVQAHAPDAHGVQRCETRPDAAVQGPAD